jgi:hypothetical protein
MQSSQDDAADPHFLLEGKLALTPEGYLVFEGKTLRQVKNLGALVSCGKVLL